MSIFVECMPHDPDPNPWWFTRLLFPTESQIPYVRFAFCRFVNGTELNTVPPTVYWPSPALGGESVLCRMYFRMQTYNSAQTLNEYKVFNHFYGRNLILTLNESNIFSKWNWMPDIGDRRNQIIRMFYIDVNPSNGLPNYVFVPNYDAPNVQTQIMMYRWFDNIENTGPDVGWAPEPYPTGLWPVPKISIFHLRPTFRSSVLSYAWFWFLNTGKNTNLTSIKSSHVEGRTDSGDWQMFYVILVSADPIRYLIKTFHNEYVTRKTGSTQLSFSTTYGTMELFTVITAAVMGRFRIMHCATDTILRADVTGNGFTLVPSTEAESPYDAFEMNPVHGNYPFGAV